MATMDAPKPSSAAVNDKLTQDAAGSDEEHQVTSDEELQVTFESGSSLVEVHQVEPIRDELAPNYWITDSDMVKTEIEIMKTQREYFYDNKALDDDKHCIRGIEGLVTGDVVNELQHIQEHREEVLTEAENQLQNNGIEELDWNKLREVSKNFSKPSQETALDMAAADEEFVQEEVLPLKCSKLVPQEKPSDLKDSSKKSSKKTPKLLRLFCFRKN